MSKIPYHLGIIVDGNRRWARERGLPAFEGHRRGFDKVKKMIDWCKNRGIKILTLFVFSTENWNRSKTEVNYLMKLLQRGLNGFKKNIKKINRNGIKIKIIGQKERIPESLRKTIEEVEELTKNNNKMVVNFALSYGGRVELVEAIKKIIEKKIPLEKITEEVIKENLWTSDVDLIIRTGGEQRISNFLIWQAAYSEFYFCPEFWPAFDEKDLDLALADYSRRQRRFGK